MLLVIIHKRASPRSNSVKLGRMGQDEFDPIQILIGLVRGRQIRDGLDVNFMGVIKVKKGTNLHQ